MNKLIIDSKKEFKIKDLKQELIIKIPEINLIVSGNNILKNLNTDCNNQKINIILEKNANLKLLKFDFCENLDTEFNFWLKENSTLKFNYSIYVETKNQIIINSYQEENNAKASYDIRAVTAKKGNVLIKANGVIAKNTINNELNEKIKILTNNDEKSIIIPNMLIATNETYANHAATIGKIDENEIFYLKSKGLSQKKASQLIKEGFLLRDYKADEYSTKIKEILRKRGD